MDLMSFKMLGAAATATPIGAVPGELRFFKGGYVGVYGQAAAATALDGTTIDAGEGCWRLGAGAAWDDPYKLYQVTNDVGQTGATIYVCGGFPLVAVPAEYYSWFVLRGPVPDVPATDTTYGFGVPIKLVDNAGAGTLVNICTTDEQMIGVSLGVDAAGVVDTFISIPYWL